ncbi:MAG: tripartite tricarboxylate transporter substrate binding protein [Reyranella sp.]|nr:tripartite tricarboxylate transporter substrate binding protein [Reyranella sp.]MBL6653481.1 tripartite tricarboxylate transporter substrate binding protein [Reyranella sp.]
MPLSRRRFQHLVIATPIARAIAPGQARAQAWPSRPVRWVVGYAPGGGNDIVARLMGQWLSDRLGQPLVIENKPGAATNIAAEFVVNAAPDGYTLLLVGQPNAINATLYDTLPFNFIRDIAPVAGIMTVPNVVVVNPSFPASTIAELIAYARANPGKVNMASAGNGSAAHLAGELFKSMTGTDMVHVPYRGQAPAIADLLSGQVQVLFATSPASMEFIKSGKLKALAVTTSVRAAALPDTPTVADTVPGYEASAWYGIGAPQKTPADIVDRLNRETNAGLADATLKARLADLGGTLIAGSPADFGKLIAAETEKWGKVIRTANIKL